MKVFAFDCDETLEISNGPVTIRSLEELKAQGHVVGLCGNWGLFVSRVRNWHHLISFVNCAPPLFIEDLNNKNHPIRMDKAWFLQEIARYVPAEGYVMVGNRPGRKNSLGYVTNSEDESAAKIAGWKFLLEDEFARGER